VLGFTTATDLRLALWAVLALGCAGLALYIHHAGYEECRAPEVAAQKAQKANDTKIDTGVSNESDQSKAALVAPGGAASTPAPHLRVCQPASSLPARPAAAKAEPSQPPASGGDRGVLPGAQPETAVDLGPVLQDLTLASLLLATDSQLLWKRDVEQAKAVPK
jgi:hypothetical protein